MPLAAINAHIDNSCQIPAPPPTRAAAASRQRADAWSNLFDGGQGKGKAKAKGADPYVQVSCYHTPARTGNAPLTGRVGAGRAQQRARTQRRTPHSRRSRTRRSRTASCARCLRRSTSPSRATVTRVSRGISGTFPLLLSPLHPSLSSAPAHLLLLFYPHLLASRRPPRPLPHARPSPLHQCSRPRTATQVDHALQCEPR